MQSDQLCEGGDFLEGDLGRLTEARADGITETPRSVSAIRQPAMIVSINLT